MSGPIFRSDGVFLTGFSAKSCCALAWNVAGLVCLTSYYLVSSALMFHTLDKFGVFRVEAKDEITGLDEIKHKEKAYEFGTKSCNIIVLSNIKIKRIL